VPVSLLRRGSAAAGELDEVPEVAVEVLEHGDLAVGLLGGRAHEADAAGAVGGLVAVAIVGLQEQQDAPAGLVADERLRPGVEARARRIVGVGPEPAGAASTHLVLLRLGPVERLSKITRAS